MNSNKNTPRSTRSSKLIQITADEFIRLNTVEKLTVRDIAKQLNVSPNGLSRYVRKKLGIQIHNNRKIVVDEITRQSIINDYVNLIDNAANLGLKYHLSYDMILRVLREANVDARSIKDQRHSVTTKGKVKAKADKTNASRNVIGLSASHFTALLDYIHLTPEIELKGWLRKQDNKNMLRDYWAFMYPEIQCNNIGEIVYCIKFNESPICENGNRRTFKQFPVGYFRSCSADEDRSYSTLECKCRRDHRAQLDRPDKTEEEKAAIVAKMQATCMERYGVSNGSKSPIILAKIKNTLIEKYNSHREYLLL